MTFQELPHQAKFTIVDQSEADRICKFYRHVHIYTDDILVKADSTLATLKAGAKITIPRHTEVKFIGMLD